MTAASTSVDAFWTLAHGDLDDAARFETAALVARSGLTAAAFLERLARDGLVPLAYRHLIARGPTGLPADLADALAGEFRRHASSRFRYARRLGQLLDLLEDAGIAALPYKGPVLAIQVYGNYAMRQYGDLDILVQPAQAPDAVEALLAAGLKRRRPASAPWEAYIRRTRHSHAFIDPLTGLLVELHWTLADRFHGVDLDTAWLMDGNEIVDLVGRPTRAMGSEQTLLALCVHGFRHLWERRAWLAEVGALARRPHLDWAQVVQRADRADFGRGLRASLLLVRDTLGIAMPTAAADRGADSNVERLARMLIERVTRPDPAPDRLRDRFRIGYLARGSFRRRAAFCWRLATHLSERDFRRLPRPPRFPAWYGLARSLRLLRRARAERRTVRA